MPRALRARADGEGWSPAFLALAAAPNTEAAFREGLARLLAQDPGPLVLGGRVASGGGTPPAAAGSAEPSTDGGGAPGLLHALAAALGALALLAGFGAVAYIERLNPATRGRGTG